MLSATLEGCAVASAAQNMFFEEQGAFTGEVSPLQLKNAGVTHVLIGHSERRHIFGEGDEMLNKKLLAAEKHGLTPVFCVGETLEQRKAGEDVRVVTGQLTRGMEGLKPATVEQMVVAYEPVWAIGTGENATPEQAQEMHLVVRKHLPELTRIVYGGSVKPANAEELFSQPAIDGFLVGGASLSAADFRKIIEAAE